MPRRPGRPPKPTRLKALDGNPGKRRLNPKEPKPRRALLTCPRQLDDAAKKEWKRIAPELHRAGLLSKLDRTALMGYCSAWSRWLHAESMLQKHGVVVRSPNNYPIQSPYLAIANKAMSIMVTFLSEFGMTPASRSRVQVGGQDRPGELESFRFELDGRNTG